jgi:TonB family protein
MVFRLSVLVGLLASSPALAQTSDSKAAQDKLNWDIFQKLYPPRAIAAHEEGAVGFTVTLDSKGQVTRCQVTHTSGHPQLDEETCKIITMNAVFTPDPNLGPSQTKKHEGLITWKLPGWATALEPPKPVTPAAAPEQIVCKKVLRAGTLAGFERTCMTPTQWAKQSDAMKQPYEDMQGKKGSSNGVICIGGAGTTGPGGAPGC